MIVSANSEGKKFDPVSAGNHPAICYAVIGIGTQRNERFDTTHKQLIIMWEICDETILIDGTEKPKVLSKTYTASLNDRSTLRKDLESWRGKAFSAEELKGFDMQNILGKPCLISVIEEEKNDRKYAKIASIASMPKGMGKDLSAVNETKMFDICENPRPSQAFTELPEWIQARCMESLEWADAESGADLPSDEDAPEDLEW